MTDGDLSQGMGHCTVINRNYYYEGDSHGNHDSRCKKQLKKGPSKWNQGQIDKCYFIPNCIPQKRDAIPDPFGVVVDEKLDTISIPIQASGVVETKRDIGSVSKEVVTREASPGQYNTSTATV